MGYPTNAKIPHLSVHKPKTRAVGSPVVGSVLVGTAYVGGPPVEVNPYPD